MNDGVKKFVKNRFRDHYSSSRLYCCTYYVRSIVVAVAVTAMFDRQKVDDEIA